jgi:hypothetical protein
MLSSDSRGFNQFDLALNRVSDFLCLCSVVMGTPVLAAKARIVWRFSWGTAWIVASSWAADRFRLTPQLPKSSTVVKIDFCEI